MAKEVVMNMGDIRRLIQESSNDEFKPVLGDGVEKEDKANNEKAYKDIKKKIKDYDGGLEESGKKEKLPPKTDANRTTLDYTPRVEPDEAYKKRVKAQAEGYTSDLEKNNGIEKAAEFDDRIYNNFKEASDELNKQRVNDAHAGLKTNKEFSKEDLKRHTLTENSNPKPKRLRFKRTEFLSEERMLMLIPEKYKVDGQQIYMVDRKDNEYLVECSKSRYTGNVDVRVVSLINRSMIAEEKERINHLFNYDKNTTSGRNSVRGTLNEDQQFKQLLNKTRGL